MSVFQKLNGEISEGQINEIVKTGVIPSNLKDPESKIYFAIFRSYSRVLYSDFCSEESPYRQEIDGEVLICEGRYNIFNKIKEFIENDEERSIDMRTSIVMVEGVDAGKSISMYRFIKLCNQSYPNEKFDEDMLEMYINGFENEEEFRNVENKAVGFGGNAGTLTNEEE